MEWQSSYCHELSIPGPYRLLVTHLRQIAALLDEQVSRYSSLQSVR